MRRRYWLLSFISGVPLALSISLFVLTQTETPKATIPPPIPQVLSASTQVYSPSYITSPTLSQAFVSADARALIIQNYLNHYNSPLEPFSQEIVAISDKYQLDYRLLVAIARQESNLCLRIPEASHNCWGFGIYGDKVTRFDNYPQALEIVAKVLKRDYLDKGLTTPEEIMAKYTPPSVEIGGPWAKGVSQFMSDLE